MVFSIYWSFLAFIILLSSIGPSIFGQWLPSQGPSQGNPVGNGQYNVLTGSNINGNLPTTYSQSPPMLYPVLPSGVGGLESRFVNSGGVASQNLGTNFHPPQQYYPNGGTLGSSVGLHTNPSSQWISDSHAISPEQSNSKSISGDYCFEPIFTCDTTNTVLYCIQGRCSCPTQWTLAPGNLPLNTVWHPELKRCVSVVGSGCHIASGSAFYPSPHLNQPVYSSAHVSSGGVDVSRPRQQPAGGIASNLLKGLIGNGADVGRGYGYVHCQPGIQCVRHPGIQEVGICNGVQHKMQSYLVAISGGIISYFYFSTTRNC